MDKKRLIFLLTPIAIIVLGIVLFCIGAGVGITNGYYIMWSGVGVFLLGLALLIILFFIRTYKKSKEQDKNNIKRG